MRIRNALSFATHSFFNDHGFFDVQVPIITTTDCEGFGKLFQVTGLDQKKDKQKLNLRTSSKDDTLDSSRDLFLTVSGRLHLESYACALGNVYLFGPRFQADKTDSPKHAAEMWMVEVEMAFTQLQVIIFPSLHHYFTRYSIYHITSI